VSDLVQITDFWARCAPFILSQYQDSTRLRGLIESGCKQSDDTEAAFFEIVAAFDLPTAKGVQLDKIGAWYREGRLGRSDADYRDAIILRAASQINGTPDEIIRFLQALFPGLSDIVYQPEYPAGFALLTASSEGSGYLEPLAPAGVSAVYGEIVYDGAGDIVYDGAGVPMYSARA
jgi:hypothetical protein